MGSGTNELHAAALFVATGANERVISARYHVLESASIAFGAIASDLHAAGHVAKSNRLLATALLARLGSELVSGITILLRAKREYPAGALLRQLVEIEYLAFQAYADPSQLEKWYSADPVTLRRKFTPQAMRKASHGLFQDKEYWRHCEIGGHPHPQARMLLRDFHTTVPPDAFLLPDSVHHIRRLWTSLRLLLPGLDKGPAILEQHAKDLASALSDWEANEHPTILAFDGISSSAIQDDKTS